MKFPKLFHIVIVTIFLISCTACERLFPSSDPQPSPSDASSSPETRNDGKNDGNVAPHSDAKDKSETQTPSANDATTERKKEDAPSTVPNAEAKPPKAETTPEDQNRGIQNDNIDDTGLANKDRSPYSPLLPDELKQIAAIKQDPAPEELDAIKPEHRNKHFLTSDELHPELFAPSLKKVAGKGVFIGIGTDQGYVFTSWMRPPLPSSSTTTRGSFYYTVRTWPFSSTATIDSASTTHLLIPKRERKFSKKAMKIIHEKQIL